MEGFKTGGRKKGTPNIVTAEIRESFADVIRANLNTLENDIKTLEPKDRIKAIIDLAKYIVPTVKAVEIQQEGREFPPIEINILPPNE